MMDELLRLLPVAAEVSKLLPDRPSLFQNPGQVYTEGNQEARELFTEKVIKRLTVPGSGIRGFANFEELYQRSQRGESCLILMEHYSNFDLPGLVHLLHCQGDIGRKIANSLLAIQAIKLIDNNEKNQLTSIFASCYSTITIYPSRYLDQVSDDNEKQQLRKISAPINHAAMRELTRRKYQGRILLLFPSGTRHRPWLRTPKTGVREVRSYLKVFQNILFVGINGNILVPSDDENMEHDKMRQDVLLYSAPPPLNARDFLHRVAATNSDDVEIKKFVASAVMAELDKIHQQGEEVYNLLKQRLNQPRADQVKIAPHA